MHEHARHRVANGTPERSVETDAAGVGLDLELDGGLLSARVTPPF
jgi:hypothetical protein